MLYGVKLNSRVELLIAKKDLVFLHFIWFKKFEISLKEGGRRGRGHISTKILLKSSKVTC